MHAGLQWGRPPPNFPSSTLLSTRDFLAMDGTDPKRDRTFSDDEASRIWRRAAELQAARRLPTAASAQEPGDQPPEPHALSRAELLTIAGEAGIDAEFVQQALMEAEITPSHDTGEPPPLHTRREIAAGPGTVLDVLRAVAPREPYRLKLVDVRRAGEASVLLFDLGGTDWHSSDWVSFRAGQLASGKNLLGVQAVVMPGSAPGTSELVVSGAPNPTLPRSLRAHKIGFGTIGAIGGGIGGFFGGTALAFTGAVVAAPVALGALALGAAGAGAIRGAQRWSLGKDREALEQFADEVVGAVRVHQHLGDAPAALPEASPPSPQLPPGSPAP